MQSLKLECKALKANQFTVAILTKTKEFPFIIQIAIPQPDSAYHFDIHEINILVRISKSFEEPEVDIEVDYEKSAIDPSLGKEIELRANMMYSQMQSQPFQWKLLDLANVLKEKYIDLLLSVPGTIEHYMGEGPNGESMRRFAAVIITAHESQSSEGESDSENEESREYWRRQRIEQDEEDRLEKEKESMERKEEVSRDPNLHAKVKVLSIKEREDLKKANDKQGKRTSKTASRRKKFDPLAPKPPGK